jgi:hypothetical protein
MLTRGNLKLGNGIWHWNLPAGSQFSCPGASPWCDASINGGCYANPEKHQHTYGSPHVQAIYQRNWEMVQDDAVWDWGIALSAWIQTKNKRARHLRNQVRVVRIHTSGDFFSQKYTAIWDWIAVCNPTVQFYAYTRSWAVPELLGILEEFRSRPNVTLWASWDHTMPETPAGWKTAIVVDKPAWAESRAGETRCPEQTGVQPDCTSCGLCWNAKVKPTAVLTFKIH